MLQTTEDLVVDFWIGLPHRTGGILILKWSRVRLSSFILQGGGEWVHYFGWLEASNGPKESKLLSCAGVWHSSDQNYNWCRAWCVGREAGICDQLAPLFPASFSVHLLRDGWDSSDSQLPCSKGWNLQSGDLTQDPLHHISWLVEQQHKGGWSGLLKKVSWEFCSASGSAFCVHPTGP